MEIAALSKSVKVSPRKMRLVADTIRDLSVTEALRFTETIEKRAAGPLIKTLKSALANATNNAKLAPERLYIKRIDINEGPVLKRFRPSTRGRVHPYKKKSSHIRIILEERKGDK